MEITSVELNDTLSIEQYDQWKSYTNMEFYNKMEKHFKKFKNHDENFNRIYIDLKVDTTDFKVTIPPEISDFFRWYGQYGPYQTKMRIVDYIKGICTDKDGREIKIGKLLNKLGEPELLKTYNDSKQDILKNVNDLQVVISRHPYDIIGMSTNRGWTTCYDLKDTRYGGKHSHKIKDYLKNGTLIAYVIRKSDRNINKPLSRCLITKYYVGEVYGTNVPGFSKLLNDFKSDI